MGNGMVLAGLPGSYSVILLLVIDRVVTNTWLARCLRPSSINTMSYEVLLSVNGRLQTFESDTGTHPS